MDYMSMTEEDFDRLEEFWLDQGIYWATGGSLDVIQIDDAAARIGAGLESE